MITQSIEVKPCECCREAERQITQLRKELEEAKAEIARLSLLWRDETESNAKLLNEIDELGFDFDVSEASNAGFKTLNYELRKALEKYGRHPHTCKQYFDIDGEELEPCSCGLDALKGD